MYEKIAMNLIGNAFKYCHKGGVTVKLRYEDQHVVLQISDTGVGIPRNQMHRIGERFFRVKTHSRSHEGTGIGLSLTKELIRLLGGSLELESWVAEEQPDGRHGSQFTVKLPLGFSHLPASAIERLPKGWSTRRFSGTEIANRRTRTAAIPAHLLVKRSLIVPAHRSTQIRL
jgi:signal transduction histidine kinase